MQRISSTCLAKTPDMKSAGTYCSVWVPLVFLTGIWTAIIFIVNPVGEFMVNDDWAFVRCLESLMREGRLETTGHGPSNAPGGPALITHLLWGLAFVKTAGFSLTVLRVSVLTLGVLASFVVFLLLRRCGASVRLSMVGTLSVVFNPLFLSQCFSFMTDITFTSFALVSILFLHIGVERTNTWIIATGLAFGLCATLTRQIGLVVPVGFVVTCFLHPKGEELGRLKSAILALGITVVPWLGYELFLYRLGSTPIIEHTMLRDAVMNAYSMDPLRYARFLLWNFLVSTVGYVCFLISPVLAVYYGSLWSLRSFRYFVILLSAALSAYEVFLLFGIVDPPVIMSGNVIYNLGIGPIVLRDTYIMGLERSATLPKAVYAVIVYWTLIAAVVFSALVIHGLRDLGRLRGTRDCLAVTGNRVRCGASESRWGGLRLAGSFTAHNCLLTALLYMAIIVPLAPYDRYLILPCALLIVRLVAGMPPPKTFAPSFRTVVPVAAPLICLAVFGVLGTRDFLEMKRSLADAHSFVLNVLRVDPCRVDGGFEFNGYHCYRKGLPRRTGLSWWWVDKEEYLITLGKLPGYHVVRTFPFRRLLGPDGEVHLLKPVKDD